MRTALMSLAASGLVLFPASVFAADPPPVELAKQVRAIAAEIRAIRAAPSLDQDERMQRTIAFASRRQRFFLIYAVLRKQSGVVLTPSEVLAVPTGPDLSPVEQARTDVQAGATSNSSGSSSLVSKGSAPSFFGVAMENGAFTQTVGATTTTFQGNLVGIFDLMGSRSYLAAYDDAAVTRFLRRFSGSLTVTNDASVGVDNAGGAPESATPAPVTPTIRDQLRRFDRRIEAYSVRAIVGRNRRDPRDGENIDALTRLMGAPAQGVLASLDDALGDLQVSDQYAQWITDSVAQLTRVPDAFIEAALLERLNALSDLAHMIEADFDDNSLMALSAYSSFLARRDRLLENLEKKKLFAVEYVRTRQPLDKDLVTYRFIAEGQRGRWDLTGNAAYRGYDSRPESGGPLYRDVQFAADATTSLGDRASVRSPLGNAALSFALLYERLFESSTVTFGDRVLAAEPGHIFVAQFRVTLPIKNAGVKVPLSVSVANRTELLDEKEIRANLGFTFNYDVIASLFRR